MDYNYYGFNFHFLNKNLCSKRRFQYWGGLIYGTEALEDGVNNDLQNDFGLDVNAYYSITDKIRVGGGFDFFFPKKVDESSGGVSANAKYTVSGLYIDGQYIYKTSQLSMLTAWLVSHS